MHRKLRRLMGATNGVLQQKEIAERAGCSEKVLIPSYPVRPLPAMLTRIAEAVAALVEEQGRGFVLPGDQLVAWLAHDQPDPTTEIALRELKKLRRCTCCGGWFDRKKMIQTLCPRCCNQRSRDAKSPGAARFRAALQMNLGALRAQDPQVSQIIERTSGIRADVPVLHILWRRDRELGTAVETVLQEDPTAALTGPQIEVASDGAIPARQYSKRMEAAIGLSKRALIALLVGLAGQVNSAQALGRGAQHGDGGRGATSVRVPPRRRGRPTPKNPGRLKKSSRSTSRVGRDADRVHYYAAEGAGAGGCP